MGERAEKKEEKRTVMDKVGVQPLGHWRLLMAIGQDRGHSNAGEKTTDHRGP